MRRKKVFNFLVINFSTLALLLVTLELSYRFQWFDFYKAELKALNTTEILQSNKKKILVCGDSFTASPESYVKTLRDSLPDYAVINAAVPGSCIIQHALYMPKRIKKFKPDIFIYQFYVGNDLFDISHPTSSPDISFTRKTYWWISDRMLSLAFLNFRFAGIKYHFYDDVDGNSKPKEKEVFSVDSYSKREKLNYKAEPALLDNTLFLRYQRKNDMELFKRKFQKMVKGLSPGCEKYFLIIPHEAEMSQAGQDKHHLLGASYTTNLQTWWSLSLPLYIELQNMCKELGFQMVDMHDWLKYSDIGESLYYTNDPHLNPLGQAYLGDLLLETIRAKTVW